MRRKQTRSISHADEHSRVTLSPSSDDDPLSTYINANFIRNCTKVKTPSQKAEHMSSPVTRENAAFIATQVATVCPCCMHAGHCSITQCRFPLPSGSHGQHDRRFLAHDLARASPKRRHDNKTQRTQGGNFSVSKLVILMCNNHGQMLLFLLPIVKVSNLVRSLQI